MTNNQQNRPNQGTPSSSQQKNQQAPRSNPSNASEDEMKRSSKNEGVRNANNPR